MKSPTLCRAAHSSARPNRQMSTTVTIRARFICWGVITLSASRAAALDAIRFIAPLNRVAVVIGEVGKNLQQAGSDQRQQGNPGIKMALLPRQGRCQQ